MTRAVAAAALALLAGCASFEPPPPTRTPLTVSEFADPAVLRAPDGWYYAYATQGAPDGRMLNIQVARSRNLARWELLGDALPQKPAWGSGKQWFWAPHVLYDAERRTYFMYYSAEPDAARGKCLAVATARQPQGPFVDAGQPLVCGDGIEHIDPMAFDDPRTGRRLLYWGSGKRPLRVQELAPHRLSFLEGSAATEILPPDAAREYESLVEAPWVVYREGSYYLFYSGSLCCGPRAHYAVLVARARDAAGPFERLGAILERDADWLAPGHPAVAQDDAGTDWLLYHAVDAPAAAATGRHAGQGAPRLLMLERLAWRDGRPSAAGRPSAGPRGLPRP
ncbi:MAG TPA: glycoside hydrolase family 43 protein [Burkholderiales bacterium]|nr:glycoside hydrolase family 43 protein [Burkholderiales bacterium]